MSAHQPHAPSGGGGSAPEGAFSAHYPTPGGLEAKIQQQQQQQQQQHLNLQDPEALRMGGNDKSSDLKQNNPDKGNDQNAQSQGQAQGQGQGQGQGNDTSATVTYAVRQQIQNLCAQITSGKVQVAAELRQLVQLYNLEARLWTIRTLIEQSDFGTSAANLPPEAPNPVPAPGSNSLFDPIRLDLLREMLDNSRSPPLAAEMILRALDGLPIWEGFLVRFLKAVLPFSTQFLTVIILLTRSRDHRILRDALAWLHTKLLVNTTEVINDQSVPDVYLRDMIFFIVNCHHNYITHRHKIRYISTIRQARPTLFNLPDVQTALRAIPTLDLPSPSPPSPNSPLAALTEAKVSTTQPYPSLVPTGPNGLPETRISELKLFVPLPKTHAQQPPPQQQFIRLADLLFDIGYYATDNTNRLHYILHAYVALVNQQLMQQHQAQGGVAANAPPVARLSEMDVAQCLALMLRTMHTLDLTVVAAADRARTPLRMHLSPLVDAVGGRFRLSLLNREAVFGPHTHPPVPPPQGSQGFPAARPPQANVTTWDPLRFVEVVIHRLGLRLDWLLVLRLLDQPMFYIPDRAACETLKNVWDYSQALQMGGNFSSPTPSLRFPLEKFLGVWQNPEGQLSFLREAASHAPPLVGFDFTAIPHGRSTPTIPNYQWIRPAPPGSQGAAATKTILDNPQAIALHRATFHAWYSLDFLYTFFHLPLLLDVGPVEALVQDAMNFCPDVLMTGLSILAQMLSFPQSEIYSTPAVSAKEISTRLMQLILDARISHHIFRHPSHPVAAPGSTNSGPDHNAPAVLQALWQLNKRLLVVYFVRIHAHDRTTLPRLVDLAHELKATLDIPKLTFAYSFVFDFVVLASRRDYMALLRWLHTQYKESPQPQLFARACLEYLAEHAANPNNLMTATGTGANAMPGTSTIVTEGSNGAPSTEMRTFNVMTPETAVTFVKFLSSLEIPLINAETQRIYTEASALHPDFAKHEQVEVDEFLMRVYTAQLKMDDAFVVLERWRTSNSRRDHALFEKFLNAIFDERRCLADYPPVQLKNAAILLGRLILSGLLEGRVLGLALGVLLESAASTSEANVQYAIMAVQSMIPRISQLPVVAEFLAQLPSWQERCPQLVQSLETIVAEQAPRVAAASVTYPDEPAGGLDYAALLGVLDTSLQQRELVVFLRSRRCKLFKPAAQEQRNVARLLAQAAARFDCRTTPVAEPPAEVSKAVTAIVNSLVDSTIKQKIEELNRLLQPPHFPWFARYIVARAAKEPNYLEKYVEVVIGLNSPALEQAVLDETYEKVTVIFEPDEITADRTFVRALGTWLGLLTLARDRPIRSNRLVLKDILIDAYDRQRLPHVLPFVAKVLEATTRSRIFKWPNPWLVSIISLMKEMFTQPDTRLNVLFEIESLFAKLFKDPPPGVTSTGSNSTGRGDSFADNRYDFIPVTNILKDRQSRLAAAATATSGSAATSASSTSGTSSAEVSTPETAVMSTPVSSTPAHPAAPQTPAAGQAAGHVPSTASAGAPTSQPGTQPPSAQPTPAQTPAPSAVAPGVVPVAPQEIIRSAILESPPAVVLSDNIPIFKARPNLRAPATTELLKALAEFTLHTFDKSRAAIAALAELFIKDFPGETDETVLRRASVMSLRPFVRSHAALAREKLRDVVCIFVQRIHSDPAERALMQQGCEMFVNDNMANMVIWMERVLELLCANELEELLKPQFARRRMARESGQPFVDPAQVLGAQSNHPLKMVPPLLRPSLGPATPAQLQVVEEFERISSLPHITSAPPAAMGSGPIMPQVGLAGPGALPTTPEALLEQLSHLIDAFESEITKTPNHQSLNLYRLQPQNPIIYALQHTFPALIRAEVPGNGLALCRLALHIAIRLHDQPVRASQLHTEALFALLNLLLVARTTLPQEMAAWLLKPSDDIEHIGRLAERFVPLLRCRLLLPSDVDSYLANLLRKSTALLASTAPAGAASMLQVLPAVESRTKLVMINIQRLVLSVQAHGLENVFVSWRDLEMLLQRLVTTAQAATPDPQSATAVSKVVQDLGNLLELSKFINDFEQAAMQQKAQHRGQQKGPDSAGPLGASGAGAESSPEAKPGDGASSTEVGAGGNAGGGPDTKAPSAASLEVASLLLYQKTTLDQQLAQQQHQLAFLDAKDQLAEQLEALLEENTDLIDEFYATSSQSVAPNNLLSRTIAEQIFDDWMQACELSPPSASASTKVRPASTPALSPKQTDLITRVIVRRLTMPQAVQALFRTVTPRCARLVADRAIASISGSNQGSIINLSSASSAYMEPAVFLARMIVGLARSLPSEQALLMTRMAMDAPGAFAQHLLVISGADIELVEADAKLKAEAVQDPVALLEKKAALAPTAVRVGRARFLHEALMGIAWSMRRGHHLLMRAMTASGEVDMDSPQAQAAAAAAGASTPPLTIIADSPSPDVLHKAFNPKVYYAIICALFQELAIPDPNFYIGHLEVLHAITSFMRMVRPTRVPAFAFAWLELLSNSQFMPRMLTPSLRVASTTWHAYYKLIHELLAFLQPFLRSTGLTDSMRDLYRSTMLLFLVLLTDFPQFLVDYSHNLCDMLPASVVQLRNVVLAAFPRGLRFPDPTQANLRLLPEVSKTTRFPPSASAALLRPVALSRIYEPIDAFLLGNSPMTAQQLGAHLASNLLIATQLRATLVAAAAASGTEITEAAILERIRHTVAKTGTIFDTHILNALVLHLARSAATIFVKALNSHIAKLSPQAVAQLTPEQLLGSSPLTAVFDSMLASVDAEGRYLIISAMANHLRFPNMYTCYFSTLLLYLFNHASHPAVQEQIIRVLFERVGVSRPFPWGLLHTVLELFRNPIYGFWQAPCFAKHPAALAACENHYRNWQPAASAQPQQVAAAAANVTVANASAATVVAQQQPQQQAVPQPQQARI